MSVWYISIKVHIFHMVSVIKGTFLFTKALLLITFICKKKKKPILLLLTERSLV